MARSRRKVPHIHPHVLKVLQRITKGTLSPLQPVKTHARGSCIHPAFIGMMFMVYNGKDFIPVKVTDEMVGRKLGEFSPTRRFSSHSGDKKAIRKKY